VFVFYAASFVAFSNALKRIETGVADAIRAGIGTAAIAIIGIVWFRESVTVLKLPSIALIVAGVVGLNLNPGDARHRRSMASAG
jgi:small multidrug resistance pump